MPGHGNRRGRWNPPTEVVTATFEQHAPPKRPICHGSVSVHHRQVNAYQTSADPSSADYCKDPRALKLLKMNAVDGSDHYTKTSDGQTLELSKVARCLTAV